jgi:hypothetical protein
VPESDALQYFSLMQIQLLTKFGLVTVASDSLSIAWVKLCRLRDSNTRPRHYEATNLAIQMVRCANRWCIKMPGTTRSGGHRNTVRARIFVNWHDLSRTAQTATAE